jgi:DNA polymerase-4
MRVGCFFFPHFAVQVEVRDNSSLTGKPVTIGGLPYERKEVYDASKEALACGVRQGMSLREAHAMCPQGTFLPLDEEKYADAFTTVLTLFANYSPVVETGAPGSVSIDLKYETNELQFIEEVRQAIEQRFRLHPFISIAPNKFAAWAASQVAAPEKVIVITEGEEKDFLKDLPVCFLPTSSGTLERLELLGIHCMGQLACLSTGAVSLEFGDEGKLLWELSNGIDGSRLIPWSKVPALMEQTYFEPEAETSCQVLAGCDGLLTGLSRQLKERWQCCLRLTISMHFSNDCIAQRVFHFKEATSGKETMLRHLKQYLESARFSAPVSEMRLTLTDFCPESGRQALLVDEPWRHRERLASAISWLRQRYGKEMVGKVLAKPNSPLPEDSFLFTEFDL